MNERELIRWAKTNCVCWAGLTSEQREFLERHKENVGLYAGPGFECLHEGDYKLPPREGCWGDTYRLRPDYEPEPEKPRMGWREYAVNEHGESYYVQMHGGTYALDAMPRVKGFGGTQFRLPNGPLTDYVATLVFMTDEGPATPVKVRFWEAI